MSASDDFSTKCSGFLLRSSFAILAARARHLFSAAPMPAFSGTSRASNSSDIDARRRQFLYLAAGATARCRSYRALQAQKTETVAVNSKRVVDGINVPGSIPALPSVHKHDTASIDWMLQGRRAATPAHS